MMLLILGLVIWSLVHLYPSWAPNSRKALSVKLGEMPYQGLFAITILLSIGLIILGWRSMVPSHIYQPVPALRHVAMLIVVIGFILMVAANFSNTRIKNYIRHPQLSGVLLWAFAHLLANGDSRSLILFTTIAIWTMVSMISINRRDGAWQKPQTVMPLYKEFIIVIIGLIIAAIVVRFHVYLAGIPLIPA
jgi:uncharacterized membrane protein